MPQDLTDDKSTLVQVMAWCRQANDNGSRHVPLPNASHLVSWHFPVALVCYKTPEVCGTNTPTWQIHYGERHKPFLSLCWIQHIETWTKSHFADMSQSILFLYLESSLSVVQVNEFCTKLLCYFLNCRWLKIQWHICVSKPQLSLFIIP